MTESACPPFSRWRALLWPVHRHELGKLIPMLLMFFFITLNYNILRCMKDSLIITAKGSGAEAIPFIKVWAMFPGTLFFTWAYIKLAKRLSRETVFYSLFSFFLLFFALFGFLFYPMREQFHLHRFADWLSTVLPLGCKGFVAMVRYWSFTLFYVMSELWGNIILFMLFWGFANQVTSFEEAKRFYGIFGIGINLSGIFSGETSILLTNYASSQGASWDTSLTYLIALVTGAGIACIGTFLYLTRYLKKHPSETQIVERKTPKEKTKMSFRKSFSCILSSRYMLALMAIVLSYNVIINLVEVLWKHEAQQLYPDTQSYSIFMNEVTVYTGVLATIVSLFISGNCVRHFGWTKTAMVTPLILLVTSIGFFSFLFLKNSSLSSILVWGLSPLNLVVLFGTTQNCLSRAAKYTFFDETKEMAYIPLSQEEKIKGKAAIDGVFNRMGKSTGSVLYQGLLLICVTTSATAPYVAIILASFLIIWMVSIRSLGSQIAALTPSVQSQQMEPAHA